MYLPYFLKHISFLLEAGSQTGQSRKNTDVQQNLEDQEKMDQEKFSLKKNMFLRSIFWCFDKKEKFKEVAYRKIK